MKITSIVAAAVLACAAGTVSAGTNLVVNGDFSSPEPELYGWTLEGDGYADAGAGMFFTGTVGSEGSLSQSVQTTLGARYSISFDVMRNVAAGTVDDSHFTAYFGGAQIYSVLGGVDSPHVTKVQPATSGETLLQFTYRNDSDWYILTNVAVFAVSEPEMCAMLLAGLALLGFAGRRRTQG